MKSTTFRSARIVALVAGVAVSGSIASGLARGEEEHAHRTSQTAFTSLTKTIANEPLAYPSTPDPAISSAIETIEPGGITEWMTHPVPAYLYVLEGTLTVEFADGTRHEFKAGESFLQCRTTWHRGRNEGTVPMRFLAVFVGAKDVPEILHPPSGTAVR